MDGGTVIRNMASRQLIFENAGLDASTACAAAFIMDNIHGGYPTEELIKSSPFTHAFTYLLSAGLVTAGRQLTEKGLQAYRLELRKIYPTH